VKPGTPPLVTVDGPAGSGKSTLGRRLAASLRLPFIDTGLFYRALTCAAARAGVRSEDAGALAELARTARIEIGTDPAQQPDVRVDGAALSSAALHDPQRADLLSTVSRIGGVRAALLEPQRSLARDGAVAVGRDCGTVVFPSATLKIYLDAATEVRASRRAAQLRARGADVSVAVIEAEVRTRDDADASRADSPMRPAADARIIDSGRTGVDEMVQQALAWCRELGIAAP